MLFTSTFHATLQSLTHLLRLPHARVATHIKKKKGPTPSAPPHSVPPHSPTSSTPAPAAPAFFLSLNPPHRLPYLILISATKPHDSNRTKSHSYRKNRPSTVYAHASTAIRACAYIETQKPRRRISCGAHTNYPSLSVLLIVSRTSRNDDDRLAYNSIHTHREATKPHSTHHSPRLATSQERRSENRY